MTLIKSVMKRRLVVARPDETVARAAQRMTDRRLGSLLVVEDGTLTGILSERDLVRRVMVMDLDPASTLVAEVATPDPVSVSENAGIKDCTRLIQQHGFRHLPVVDEGGRPIGIISSRDFLQFVVERLEVFIDQATRARRMEEITDPYDGIEEDA